MPASTLDPVSAALRTALTKPNVESSLDGQLAGATKKALLTNIEFESAGSYQSNVLDKLKSKYIVLKAASDSNNKLNKSINDNSGNDETLPAAKHVLYPHDAVQLGWNNSDWAVGAGMVNMGNTCYLNSTIQALFHVPALVNWLVSDKQKISDCEDSGSHCVICAMRKTLLDSQQRNISSIRPFLIYNKLRVVCRNLIPGRQEDAHEFLRYLVEAMEKSYLNRFKNHSQFDSRTKETTPLNQILGGYLRSAVRCLACGNVSTTFQHFQDLLLDIRKAQTLDEALDGYFAREQLDDESYHCEACRKKVKATKQFSLEKAPMVLCIQLKRFSVTNNKITKNIQFKQRLELGKFARQRPSTPLVYRLVAMVTHMGPTVGCGHYTAVAQAPCGNFYQFDDSMVRPISNQAVFTTNAYIMLYELERTAHLNGNKKPTKPTATVLHTENGCKQNSNGKVYGPELPPAKTAKLEDQNGTITSSRNGHATASPTWSSDSDCEPNNCSKENNTNNIRINSPIKNHSHPPQQNGGNTFTFKNNHQPSKSVLNNKANGHNTSTSSTSSNGINGSASTPTIPSQSQSSSSSSVVSSSLQQKKSLVPYDDEDDDSSCDEVTPDPPAASRPKIIASKATNGEWSVTSSTDDQPSSTSSINVVGELLKNSHGGYTAPVASWNGSRSQLSKEVANEKREDRKRALNDDADTGRVKHIKTSNGMGKSNPGYNPFQEHHNAKVWSNQSNSNMGGNNSYVRPFYGNRRHQNHKRFQHKNNYHKSYRYRN
ncbi:ubiquitin carboxyl-terminal hydrolase 36 [Atheta coriaria]|uniref:ubiquitin carboxyl-terminal hydrolase 36 n=1 Tax=Dalotia coriaria TaxID=877792 RepID=UPI0031F47918